jgi:hypothetical protein
MQPQYMETTPLLICAYRVDVRGLVLALGVGALDGMTALQGHVRGGRSNVLQDKDHTRHAKLSGREE